MNLEEKIKMDGTCQEPATIYQTTMSMSVPM